MFSRITSLADLLHKVGKDEAYVRLAVYTAARMNATPLTTMDIEKAKKFFNRHVGYHGHCKKIVEYTNDSVNYVKYKNV